MNSPTIPWLRALGVWLLLMAAETVHGILRTFFLEPILGDFRARQVSVFSGSLLILAISYLAFPWLRTWDRKKLLAIGVLWVSCTILFEIVLARLILRLSWERILSDYNPSQGGLLPIGLAVLLFAPLLAGALRERREP
ncbi:MAG: hypothetical protein AB1405_09905 [Bdellovibrionota bacterium]